MHGGMTARLRCLYCMDGVRGHPRRFTLFCNDCGRTYPPDSEQRISSRVVAVCIGDDPLCPCQDGDACHYRDAGDGKTFTRAMPVPGASWYDGFA
jgi:hypothetical protein